MYSSSDDWMLGTSSKGLIVRVATAGSSRIPLDLNFLHPLIAIKGGEENLKSTM